MKKILIKDTEKSKNFSSECALSNNTIVVLKKICKFLGLKNYCHLKKSELIVEINKHHSVLKIQKFIRKIFSREEYCSLSCEPIKYPCFAFKTQRNVLIYYNLESLRSFLIKSGDFRDPNTRAEYSEENVLQIDNMYKQYKSKIDNKDSEKEKLYFSSVHKAFKNKKFYQKIREKELELLTYERILDRICEDMKLYIDENRKDNHIVLTTVYLFDYRVQFKRLNNRSKEHAEYVIKKNIENINQVIMKENNYIEDQLQTCNYIVAYFYQLQEEITS